MAQAIDALVEQISQLTKTVQDSRAGDPLDLDKLAAQLAGKITELNEARAVENQKDTPAYRTGALVGPDGTAITKANRYYSMIKDFAERGTHKSGMVTLRPIDVWLAGLLVEKARQQAPERVKPLSDEFQAARKALTSDTVGAGDEYVPTNLAQTLWDDLYLASKIAGTMVQMTMTSNPMDIPLGLGRPTWRKGRQLQPTTPSDPTTAKVTLAATELVTEQGWSYTMDEDTAIALMPAFRTTLAASGGEIIDDFALNADSTLAATGNINSDDASPAADAYYLSEGQDGLRHQHLVDNTAQTLNAGGDALADADITGTMALMGKYAADPSKLVIATDVRTYLNGFLKTGSGTPGEYVSTIDKIGNDAIIKQGTLAMYRGISINVSESYRLAEADGKQNATAASNTLGGLTIYNRMLVAFLRNLLMALTSSMTSLREAVATHGTRSTNTHTAGVRNVLV